jgi:Sulfotransferase domain
MIVWLASYPRSGNTLTRIILNAGFGLKSASIHGDRKDIGAVAAVADAVGHIPGDIDVGNLESLRGSEQLHAIKTHDPPSPYMSHDDRFVCIIRDGRDAVVSYFHYLRDFGSAKPASVEQVAAGAVPAGAWSDHVEAWRHALYPRTLLLRYETLVAERGAAIQALSEFLDIEATGAPVPSFESLSALDGRFFRRGVAGGGAAELDDDAAIAFWLHNGRVMIESGYGNDVPEHLAPILSSPGAGAIDQALKKARERITGRDAAIRACNKALADATTKRDAPG